EATRMQRQPKTWPGWALNVSLRVPRRGRWRVCAWRRHWLGDGRAVAAGIEHMRRNRRAHRVDVLHCGPALGTSDVQVVDLAGRFAEDIALGLFAQEWQVVDRARQVEVPVRVI